MARLDVRPVGNSVCPRIREPAARCAREATAARVLAISQPGIAVEWQWIDWPRNCLEQSRDAFLLTRRRSFGGLPLAGNPAEHRCDPLGDALEYHSFDCTVELSPQVGHQQQGHIPFAESSPAGTRPIHSLPGKRSAPGNSSYSGFR